MKFNYQSHANKSGIYKILNTHTNRVYVGQAQCFKKRWSDYKRDLPSGKNHNTYFANDYSKCKIALGHDDFLDFHILEVMDCSTKEERNKREEYWIAQFWDDQDKCYNFKRLANAKPRSRTSKWKKRMSAVSKRKISLGRTKHLQAHPESLKPTIEGRKVWCKNNPDRLLAITSLAGKASAVKRAITITLKNPGGEVVVITNVAEFSRKNGLQPDYLINVFKGTGDIYRGWVRMDSSAEIEKEKSSKKHKDACSKSWIFLSPERKLNEFRNLSEFCKRNDLSNGNMQMVANGIRKQHKGWTKPA